MKNVLFATTALVAFAGAASAEVSFSGDLTVGYNDEVENGVYADGSLSFSGSADLGDNVTATLAWDFLSYTQAGAALLGANSPTVTIAYDNGSLNAELMWGDLNDKGASERFYSDRSGMSVDVENQDDGVDIAAQVGFGAFNVAAGCGGVGNNTCDGVNVGIGATFGSIELGVGYDDASGGQTSVTAVSVDAEFGAATVGVSYASSAAEESIGVEVGYTVSDALSVGAYYASNTVLDDQYGVSVDYTAGAITLGVYYDNVDDGGAGTGRGEYGVDVAYAISDALTANASYFNGEADLYNALFVSTSTVGGYYAVGVDYAVNDSISATLSYATADGFGAPEYKQGITAFITAEF